MGARIVVGGIGNPWLGDLDFGPRFIRLCGDVTWPPGVLLVEMPWPLTGSSTSSSTFARTG